MAQRFDVAEERLFENVYICRRCNARNRMQKKVEDAKCRKCGYKGLRKKQKQPHRTAGAGATEI